MFENSEWENIYVPLWRNNTDYLNEAKNMFENKSIMCVQTSYLSQYKMMKIYK